MQLTRSEKVVLGQLNTVLSYGANFNILPIKYSDVPVRQEEISCILILLLKLEFLKNYKGRRGKHENDLSHTETEYYLRLIKNEEATVTKKTSEYLQKLYKQKDEYYE